MTLAIEPCTTLDHPGWLALRQALWPDGSAEEHRTEMAVFLADPERYAQFVARDGEATVGLVEVSLRHDYVLGADGPPPIGFLEGLFVAPSHRRRGVARQLVQAGQDWVAARGCTVFASDALLHNTASHATHRALGFAETERVVCFVKRLESAA